MNFSFLKLFLVLIILPVFINSCKKEDPIKAADSSHLVAPDFSHFQSNYYCQVVKFTTYEDTERDTFDIVISSSIEDGKLKVFGFGTFTISSPTQTYFSDDYGTGPSSRFQIKHVSFYNDYNSIIITFLTNDGYGGESKYIGTKSNFLSSSPNLHLDSLSGQYLLNIRKNNLETGLDTSYTAIVSVNNKSRGIEIENEFFEFNNFYSTCHHHNKLFQNSGDDYGSVYWNNDSLDLTYHKVRDSIRFQQGSENCYYYFSGVKN